MRGHQRMTIGGISGISAISGISVGSPIRIGIIDIRRRGVQLNAPAMRCVGFNAIAMYIIVSISDHNDAVDVIWHDNPFVQCNKWEMIGNSNPTLFGNSENSLTLEE